MSAHGMGGDRCRWSHEMEECAFNFQETEGFMTRRTLSPKLRLQCCTCKSQGGHLQGPSAWPGHLYAVAGFYMRIPMHNAQTMALSFKTLHKRELDNDWADVIFP